MGKKSKKAGSSSSASKKFVQPNSGDEDHNIVPFEVSKEEYNDLVQQVSELSIEEAQEEWIQCARYGEVDAIRALVHKFPLLVNFVDSTDIGGGNTALHMAAANGHLSVMKLLVLKHNHPMTKNKAGNTPLHWAASNGQSNVVEFLTKQQSKIAVDVLDKNEFGRSALTEGFTSQKEDVVASLLEHDSATEEKLLATDNSKSPSSIVHNLFRKENPLLIRELAIANADNPFADTDRPDQDTTGFSIWGASLVLARWMMSKTKHAAEFGIKNDDNTNQIWSDCSVLELGAGCGVPGLAIAKYYSRSGQQESSPEQELQPKRVYLTDLNPKTVENLRHNIELNKLTSQQGYVEAIRMDWQDKSTWPACTKDGPAIDYVVGSDLIYSASLVPLLVSVVTGLVRPGGTFFYVAPDTGRAGLDEFLDEMKRLCPNWKERAAPEEYLTNPLTSQDEDEFFLHFQELSTLTYILYEFPIPID